MRTWEADIHVRYIEEPRKEQVEDPKAAATSPAPTATPIPTPPGPIISWQVGKFPARSLMRVTWDPQKEQLARNAVAKFESTTRGQWLRDALVAMFFEPKTRTYRTRIQLLFVDTIAFNTDPDTLGSFYPPQAGATEYLIEVINYEKPESIVVSDAEYLKLTAAERAQGEYEIRCSQSWPGVITPANSAWSRRLCFVDDPAAMMAETMFHELLHVWFVNGGADVLRSNNKQPVVSRPFATGHENHAGGQYDPDFHDQLTQMIDELNRPHAEALRQFNASPYAK